MMMVRSRTILAAFTAYAILLVIAAPSFPSYDTEAGRTYDIARQRTAEFKKSKKRQRYRSYWVDCIRTFELVEKKYPRSTYAADACLERAGLYLDMYRVSRRSRDKKDALRIYTGCQAAYPNHDRAPEALFRSIEIHLNFNKDSASARNVYNHLAEAYPGSVWTGKAKSLLGITTKRTQHEAQILKPSVADPASSHDASHLGMVTGIRHWSSDAYTRIVIDLDKPVKTFESHELREPDRLVFDLPSMRIEESLHKESLELNNGMLRKVRSSQYAPDTVRIVLDLANIKSYAAFPLHDPERLVIDVSGSGTSASSGSTGNGAQEQASGANAAGSQSSATDAGEGNKLSLSNQLALKISTIAIDAGHGGQDPGAIGRGGLKEKNVTLDIAKRLSKLVRDKLSCKVIMTRDSDVFIPLEERPAIARTKGADIFVSIHVNANRKRRARGIETYIQGLNATDRDAMATAARENATTTKKLSELDSELEKILKGLSMQSDDVDSVHLAHAVQKSLVDTMKPVQGHVVNLGVKRAFFYVLINTEMPSILAEVGFISNQDEEHMLKKESHRQKIAEALFEGIKKFVEDRKPAVMGI